MTRKEKQYKEQIMPNLKKKFSYTNDLQVPKLLKIVINRGVNAEDSKTGNILEEMVKDITIVSGQKPLVNKSKKSIATFKLREGMPNGISVTLRKDLMYSFLDRFISIASPRIRDFRGFKIKSDRRGNFTIGIADQRIFVELENRTNKGFNITFVTSANTDDEGRALLEEMGFPFSKN